MSGPTAAARVSPPTPRPSWRSVVLPSEHGGWGLTAEPVLLGLLVAPSTAGVAIGVATMLAFLARTPLKVVLVDRHRHRELDRTALARRVFAPEALVLVGLLIGAWATADGPFWVPLLLAVPLIGTELWFDLRSRSRRLVPELAGSIGIGASAAAIVLAADLPWETAAGVWLVIAARAVASIPFVRNQLARAKKDAVDGRLSDIAQLVAVAAVAGAWSVGWLPFASVVVVAALGIVQLALARTRPPRAAIVGVQQLAFGLVVVVVTAWAIS